MTIDPATGVISGLAPAVGIHRPLVTVTDGTAEVSTFVTIRIQEPVSGPVEHTPLPDALFLSPPGAPLRFALEDFVDDPDTSEAICISTNLGDIDTILFAEACPAHVANLFAYIDRGDYTDVIFHRSAVTTTSGVAVVQAGLMKPDGAGDYTRVDPDPTVPDEPGLSNLAGSFAMAKTSARNSGSTQWYFNTIDNTNLDGPQSNGGYTVFGRATTPSLPVLAEMHSRPRGNYTVMIDGLSQTLNDWPTTVVPAGATPVLEELVTINSVTHIDALLTCTLNTNSNPAVVHAALNGSELMLSHVPGATGAATITVDVADLDGTLLPVSLDYCVLDLDLVAGLSAGRRLTATFNHEKLPASLSYEVQRSTDGLIWTGFWSTGDGLGAPAVVGNDDQGTHWRLTVEDSTISPPATQTALVRIVVTKSN
jgi:peptidyl-prolyl cis-trans isomerase A (cyclophilin A)